jgi:fucose permease
MTKVNRSFCVANGPYVHIWAFFVLVGRMSGTFFMSYFKPARLLGLYALMCCLLLPVVTATLGGLLLLHLRYRLFYVD